METINNTSTGTSAWAPTGVLSLSPIAQRQGSGLPFASPVAYPSLVITDGLGHDVAGMTAHKTADAKVPDPRGRKR